MDVDVETVEEREAAANFLRTLAKELKYDQVFVVGKSGDAVDAMWYGDNLVIYSMACLGKKSVWNIITGKGEAQSKNINNTETDWDINKI